jgi:hypothetical protein
MPLMASHCFHAYCFELGGASADFSIFPYFIASYTIELK